MEEPKKEQENNRRVPTKITAIKGDRLTTLCLLAFFLFVFLFSFEFLRKNYIWLYVGFAFFVFTNRFWRFRAELVILAVLSLSMVFYDGPLPDFSKLLRIFAFPLCYFVGSNLMVEREVEKLSLEKHEKRVSWAVYAFALGTFLHFFINFLINLGSGGARNTIDFWSGEARSATNQAALGMLMIGVALALFFSNHAVWKKLLGVLSLAIVLLYSLTLAGRTSFIMVAIVGVVAALFLWLMNPDKDKTALVSCILFVLILVVIGLFVFNAFGIQDVIKGSNLFNRFFGEDVYEGVGETDRWGAKGFYLDNFFTHMFGGGHLNEEYGNYAHDILLDTHDGYGFIAFLSVAVFLIVGLYQTLRFAFDRRFSFNTRQLVLCFNLVCFVLFFLEPVLQGLTWLFAAFCFVQGAMAGARQNADLIWEER